MSRGQIIALLIHIAIVAIALLAVKKIRRNVHLDQVVDPPLKDISILFITYVGLIILVFTGLFWEWSGMASIDAFYLIIVAPIVLLIIAYKQYQKRKMSIYHKWTFYIAVSYFVIAPITFLLLFHFAKN